MKSLESYCRHTLYRGVYTDGNLYSHDLVKLALAQKTLTYNKDFLIRGYYPKPHKTPFNQIEFVKADEMGIPLPKTLFESSISINELAKDLLEAVKKYFIEVWDDSPKLIHHSGGFDSRIISIALAELRDERGTDWIGDIHFRCHQPEEETFYKIMEAERWDKKYYSAWVGNEKDYYDVGSNEYTLNGWQSYNQVMNFWSDIVPRSKEKKYTLINGWGGEIFRYLAEPRKGNGIYSSNHALDILINSPANGMWETLLMCRFKNLLLPFFSHKYLSISMRVPASICSWDDSKRLDNIRASIMRNSTYPQLNNIGHSIQDYAWNMSDKRKGEMYHRWYNSLFYKKYKSELPLLNIDDMYGWDARTWSFMTVYERIFNKKII